MVAAGTSEPVQRRPGGGRGAAGVTLEARTVECPPKPIAPGESHDVVWAPTWFLGSACISSQSSRLIAAPGIRTRSSEPSLNSRHSRETAASPTDVDPQPHCDHHAVLAIDVRSSRRSRPVPSVFTLLTCQVQTTCVGDGAIEIVEPGKDDRRLCRMVIYR